jgi:D-methionine transport system permease protein
MSLELSIPLGQYAKAFVDTLTMVGVSGAIAFFAGIPVAVLLNVTTPGGFLASPRLNRALGSVVNSFRATPFIVLMVALIPVTRLVTGTSIGVWAAIVPLSISATPFFARIAEVCLREVDPGLIEAAQAMGCKKWEIVRHVYLPEALPGIVGGFTITLVALISSSAMAGAVGAGGLGDLAIRYGYQRFDTEVMVIVIVVLIALVTTVQAAGDYYVRWLKNR